MKENSKSTIPPVTAVIITYNESANLRRTLPQLYWCEEIVIVDSFSTDGTDSIARISKCRLLQREFNGFGDQKSFAVSQSKNDWILCLDADEYLTPELIEEIRYELIKPGEHRAFSFPSNLVFRKQRFRFGRESNRQVVKLFNRRYGHVSNDRVHEKIQVQGKIKKLGSPLLHYSYRDITQYLNKFDRYTEWCAEKYHLAGKRKSKTFMTLSIPYYFIKYYLVDRNFLNGRNGIYWSALMAFYHFIKYIKLEDFYLPVEPPSVTTGKIKMFSVPENNPLITIPADTQ
jgi:glycosyltransferase involved in cell wall biosynthesis